MKQGLFSGWSSVVQRDPVDRPHRTDGSWSGTAVPVVHSGTYPVQMREIHPPKLAQVERDATWHPGYLEAWRHDCDGWRAYVRHSVGVGLQHLEWVNAERVRQQSLSPR